MLWNATKLLDVSLCQQVSLSVITQAEMTGKIAIATRRQAELRRMYTVTFSR